MDEYLDTGRVAEYLGVSTTTVHGLTFLAAAFYGGVKFYRMADVKIVKAKYYADGLTLHDLAAHNSLHVETVRRRLDKYHVRPCGIDRRRGCASVYAADTLRKVAHLTKIDPP